MNVRRLMWSAAFLSVLGCSHAPVHVKIAGAPILPTGWQLVKDDEDRMQIGVPGGWRNGADAAPSMSSLAGAGTPDLSTPDSATQSLSNLQNSMDEASKQAEQEELAKLREKGIFLHMIDSSRPTPGEERTRYYVQKVDHGGNWSLEAARDDEVDYYKGWGATAPKLMNLPIGPVYKITADHKTRGGDEVERISYVAVDGPHSYFLRFISTNNPQAVLSIADDVAKTWRIVPGKD